MTYCEGKCCRDAWNFVEFDHDSAKWMMLDRELNLMVQIYFCPFCGKPLGFKTVPLKAEQFATA